MKNFEKICAVLLGAFLVTAFFGVMGMEEGATGWPGLLCGISFACAIAATLILKIEEHHRRRAIRKRATYREVLEVYAPEYCDEQFIGGCHGCPCDYFVNAPKEGAFNCKNQGVRDSVCRKCWDQEVAG